MCHTYSTQMISPRKQVFFTKSGIRFQHVSNSNQLELKILFKTDQLFDRRYLIYLNINHNNNSIGNDSSGWPANSPKSKATIEFHRLSIAIEVKISLF
jgi:hypothetical protein